LGAVERRFDTEIVSFKGTLFKLVTLFTLAKLGKVNVGGGATLLSLVLR